MMFAGNSVNYNSHMKKLPLNLFPINVSPIFKKAVSHLGYETNNSIASRDLELDVGKFSN